jgi:hypothetical protein
MYKTLSMSLLITMLVGCSSTTALKHFDKNELEIKALQYTKKADLIINNEQKILLWGTYLNNIDIKKFNSKDELFLVSIYFVNQESQDLNKNVYSFTLNEQKAQSVEEIKITDKKYKDILFKNTWGKYYLVRFDNIKNNYKLTLSLNNLKNNSAILNFEK